MGGYRVVYYCFTHIIFGLEKYMKHFHTTRRIASLLLIIADYNSGVLAGHVKGVSRMVWIIVTTHFQISTLYFFLSVLGFL